MAAFTAKEQEDPALPELIRRRRLEKDAERVVLSLPGYRAASYAQVTALADRIAEGAGGAEVYGALEADMAKALGHALKLRLEPGKVCLCIDGLQLREDSFLDVGEPLGPCIPVVIKTLVLG